MFTQVSRITLASAALVFATSPVFALDAEDFGAKFKGVAKLMGLSVDFASASVDGDTVVLSGFVLSVPGEEPAEAPGALTFSGVTENSDGSYYASTASIDDIAFEDEDLALSFSNIVAEGINIPATATLNDVIEIAHSLYERISAGPLLISVEGSEVFAIDSIEAWIDQPETGRIFGSGYAISGIRADLSDIPDAEARAVVAAFGIEQLSGQSDGYALWDIDTGRLEITEGSFSFENLGKIDVTGVIAGYTEAFYRDLMKTSLKLVESMEAGEIDTLEQAEQVNEAMLAQFAQLQIERLSVRYDDDSLFMKVLDFIGAEQGIDGKTFASGLKFMVPMMLTEVQNPEFTAMVTGSVNAFIDDPRNLEIAAEPETPVGFEVLAEAEEDPLALIDILSIKVRANQ